MPQILTFYLLKWKLNQIFVKRPYSRNGGIDLEKVDRLMKILFQWQFSAQSLAKQRVSASKDKKKLQFPNYFEQCYERFEPSSHFISRLTLIVRVNVAWIGLLLTVTDVSPTCAVVIFWHVTSLKMTTAQVVETSVNVNNSPVQDYVHSDDHKQPTYFEQFL